jgi:biotin carboxyl carrier protein
MKLRAEIAGENHQLSFRREGARLFAEVEGRRYELEAREVEAGVYTLLIDGRVYECRVEGAAARGGATKVEVGGHSYEVTLSDPKRLRGAGAGSADAGGRAEIKALMPGKIVRVLVGVGASVEAGDALVVVEAMKMQNEMKSPKVGTVIEVRAQAGTTVNAGDVLVVIE